MRSLHSILLSLLLILGFSCTPEPDTIIPVKKANFTIKLDTSFVKNAAKYEVGFKNTDGKIVTSRTAVSLQYTFNVNTDTYIIYANAYDENENIIGKTEKKVSVTDGKRITLSLMPTKMRAIFNIPVTFAMPLCITDVKFKINNNDEYSMPYAKYSSLEFDKIATKGTYSFYISFTDKNGIAYFETDESVFISEKEITKEIEPQQIKVTPLSFNIKSNSEISPSDEITISCETENVKIYYTTDDSDPSSASTLYTGSLTFAEKDSPVTIKAIGIADELEASEIQTATFNINSNQIASPKIIPGSCIFPSSQLITITHSNENAVIYYTTDETEPTEKSYKYTEPFYIYNTATVKAIAYYDTKKSSVISESYTLQHGTLARPQIIENNSLITLASDDTQASIYYTIDDSVPSLESLKYTEPFKIDYNDKDVIVRAKAYRDGFTSSEIADKIFYCNKPASLPVITITPESGSISSSNTFTVDISSSTIPTNATCEINGETRPLLRNKNVFRVSDFVTVEGSTLTIKVYIENDTGTAQQTTQLIIAEPKLTGKFNELRIYQVMVESFQSGNSLGFYQGYGPSKHDGDIRGIINALDYIKGLGMNALWLTPIFDTNADKVKDKKLAATGYYAYDFFSIEPNFGTIEDFKELVDKCHERNIYIILDGVFGHWSELGCKASPSGLVPERSHGMYDGCDYPGTNNCTLEFFKEVATYWIENYKIDGWRLDQCYQAALGNGKEGEGCYTGGHNYWYEIREAIEEAANANGTPGTDWGSLGYMVGEHWNGNDSNPPTIQRLSVAPGTAAGYGLRSCFDFPSRYKLVQMFAMEESKNISGKPLTELDYVMKSAGAKGYYHPSVDIRADNYVPNLFITNHDLVRFGDLVTWKFGNNNYYKRHKVALSTLAAYTGPITIYYGDEIGAKSNITSSSDNAGRTTGKISDFDSEEQDLHDYVAKLMTIRNENEALWNGTYEKLEAGKTFFAAKKSTATQSIVYLVNYSDSSVSYNVGCNGTDLMTGESTSSTVSVPALSAMFILKD